MSNGFRGRHFPADFILLCVRWYLKFNVSYRQLSEMMEERGVQLSYETIRRWCDFGTREKLPAYAHEN